MSLIPTFPQTLRGTTLAISATSALCAYPAASHLVGPWFGAAAVGVVSIVTYSCWHYAGTQQGDDESSWLHRIASAAVAIAAATVMMNGIVVSADLSEVAKTQQANAPISTLYQAQESTRLELVKTLSVKLAETDNRADPNDYKRLSDQLDAALIPTPATTTTSVQKNLPVISAEYKWSIAAVLEGSIPVLLILAGLFERRRQKEAKNQQLPKRATQGNSGQQQGNTGNDPDPMEIFSDKVVALNEKGAVTLQAIAKASGESPKIARKLRDQATEEGWLYALGNGNAASYFYWDFPQPEEQLPLLRSVK